jgi:ribonuclease P/MRP protein subunit POP5
MPVNRRGRRYLGIRVFGEGSFTTKEVVDTIQKRVLDFYGARGLSEIEPVLIDFDDDSQEGILRCNRDGLRQARAALALVTNISDSPASVHVERVSGTIKSLKSKHNDA